LHDDIMGEAEWLGPLSGIRVIDLTRVLAGPFATMILGDLGAEVLKIEPPGAGDETRTFHPFVDGESHYFLALNRSKKSLVVDLKHPEGLRIVQDLVSKSDVLIHNFRPGVVERLGLSYDSLVGLNPGIIYCSISGFGLSGPLREKVSFDIVIQAMSGAMSINGEPGGPPVKLGIPLGDMVGGIFGSIAVLAALEERHRTGRGRYIDISLFDGMLGMLGYLAQLYFVTGRSPGRVGSSHHNLVPYGVFPAQDGYIVIACLTQRFWQNLCQAIERPDLADDPRYLTYEDRLRNRDELNTEISAIMRTRTVREWVERFDAFDVPNAPIFSIGEALEHPHASAREMVVSVPHPTLGELRLVGRPIKFVGERQAPLKPPPLLGQHTREVLESILGYSTEYIDQLEAQGVINRRGG